MDNRLSRSFELASDFINCDNCRQIVQLPWGQGRRRAQSAPLGLLLVLSLVIVGSSVVISPGATALVDTESGLDVSRAETGMTQLDSQAAIVAFGNSDS